MKLFSKTFLTLATITSLSSAQDCTYIDLQYQLSKQNLVFATNIADQEIGIPAKDIWFYINSYLQPMKDATFSNLILCHNNNDYLIKDNPSPLEVSSHIHNIIFNKSKK